MQFREDGEVCVDKESDKVDLYNYACLVSKEFLKQIEVVKAGNAKELMKLIFCLSEIIVLLYIK